MMVVVALASLGLASSGIRQRRLKCLESARLCASLSKSHINKSIEIESSIEIDTKSLVVVRDKSNYVTMSDTNFYWKHEQVILNIIYLKRLLAKDERLLAEKAAKLEILYRLSARKPWARVPTEIPR